MPFLLKIRTGGLGRQRGMAMIMVISLFALMSSYLIANGLSRTQAEVGIEQDRRTLQAMQQAKAALIAHAASEAWGTDGANDQPGALPCPAADDAGVAGSSCTATASTRVGRFPWKTFGGTELRDGSGQILWYALSANFRKASGTTVINSDTEGTLTVTGNAPATKVVAVIIAPGSALDGQDRSSGSGIASYLESTNASGTDTFVTKTAPDTWRSTTDREAIFNDKILIVTQADLMAVVEPAVADRIEKSVKPYIDEYFYVNATNLGWSAFPFPATFASPDPGTSGTGTTRAQSSFIGSALQTSGLLPLSTSASYTWASGTVTLIGGTASSATLSSPCTIFSVTSWRCNITVNSLNSPATCGSFTNRHCIVNPRVRVAAGIGGSAGLSFADLPSASSVVSNRTLLSSPAATIGGTLDSIGVGTVNYEASQSYSSYQSSAFTRTWRITIPAVVSSPLTSSSDTTSGWFIKNEWYRQTYYAVSTGYLPGGGSSCVAGSTCLTVNNLPSSYATANDKRAILIFAGRALTGSRPSSSLTDYLEDQNLTPADRIFTHRYGSALTLNDRAIVLSP